MRLSRRTVTASVAMAVVVLLGVFYVVGAAGRVPSPTGAAVTSGGLLVVELGDGAGRVERVDDEDPAVRSATGMSCLRVHARAGVTSCLALAGPGPTYSATVTAPDGGPARRVALPGIPSRTKVSASGNVVTWTSFVTGDSYSVPGGFSTRTGYLDLRTGEVVESIEHFAAQVDGAPFAALDVNYWGMTVAADDRTFYATMASGGRTWLVRGDTVDRTVRTVGPSAECPSLSPDGTRVAYKKRTSRFGPWELAVYDLATATERVLPGTVGVDDQAEWLDDGTLAYAAVPAGGRLASVYVVPADGTAAARLLVAEATSPVAAG